MPSACFPAFSRQEQEARETFYHELVCWPCSQSLLVGAVAACYRRRQRTIDETGSCMPLCGCRESSDEADTLTQEYFVCPATSRSSFVPLRSTRALVRRLEEFSKILHPLNRWSPCTIYRVRDVKMTLSFRRRRVAHVTARCHRNCNLAAERWDVREHETDAVLKVLSVFRTDVME